MKNLKCNNCNNNFEWDEQGESVFCPNCGDECALLPEESTDDVNTLPPSPDMDVQIEPTEESSAPYMSTIAGKLNHPLMIICGAIAAILTIILICVSCSGGLSDRDVKELLADNGYIFSNVEVVKKHSLPPNVKGLTNSNKNKLLLLKTDNKYGYVIANTKTDKITVPVFGFLPLNVVQDHIFKGSKSINIECFDVYKWYIEKYGVDCMSQKMQAEWYLKKLTDENIITVDKAQSIINSSIPQTYSNVNNVEIIEIIYKDNSAVPLYYITQSSELAFNSTGPFPSEYVYNVWKSTTDRQTQNLMYSVYGWTPYVNKTIYTAYDSDMKNVGTYKNLEEAKKQLLKKGSSKSGSTNSKKTTEAPKKTDEPKQTTEPTETPTSKSTKPTPNTTYKYSKQTSSNARTTQNSEYYSFLDVCDDGLRFNFTPQEYLDKYNYIKSRHEGGTDNRFKSSDLLQAGEEYNIHNIYTKRFFCPFSDVGYNKNFYLFMGLTSNPSTLCEISLGLANEINYQEDSRDAILAEFEMMIEALGIPAEEVDTIINEMSYNRSKHGFFATYSKGLALFFDDDPNEQSTLTFYKIVPCTKEQWRKIPKLQHISVN